MNSAAVTISNPQQLLPQDSKLASKPLSFELNSVEEQKLFSEEKTISLTIFRKKWKDLLEEEKKAADSKYNIQNRKLLMMKFVEKTLERSPNEALPIPPKVKKQPQVSPVRTALYCFLILINIITTIVAVAVEVTSIDSNIFLTATLSFIAGAISIAAKTPALKANLKIPRLETLPLIPGLYEKQLKSTSNIILKLENVSYFSKLTNPIFREYYEIAQSFDEQIRAIQISDYQETTSRKITRGFLSLINLLLVGFGGYFLSNYFLNFFMPALLGTPLGWGIIISFTLLKVIADYASDDTPDIFPLMNPTAKRHMKIKDKIEKFQATPKLENIFSKEVSKQNNDRNSTSTNQDSFLRVIDGNRQRDSFSSNPQVKTSLPRRNSI